MYKISVEQANFPVSIEEVGTITGYNVINKERSSLIVGKFNNQKNILGIHSGKYSLVSNGFLIDTINEVLSKFPISYSIEVSTFAMLQFNIEVKMASYCQTIGNLQDEVVCCFNFRNGFDGKLKFGMHGVGKTSKSSVKDAFRLSVYRLICKNGLHGWVNEAISFNEYREQLKLNSSTRKVEKYQEVDLLSEEVNKVGFTQKHSGINQEKFKANITESIEALVRLYEKAKSGESNTLKVYDEMALYRIFNAPDFLKNLSNKIGGNHLPAKLHNEVLTVMNNEQNLIGSDGPNAWLLYNGINRALSNSGKTLTQTYQADEMAFNGILEEVFV